MTDDVNPNTIGMLRQRYTESELKILHRAALDGRWPSVTWHLDHEPAARLR